MKKIGFIYVALSIWLLGIAAIFAYCWYSETTERDQAILSARDKLKEFFSKSDSYLSLDKINSNVKEARNFENYAPGIQSLSLLNFERNQKGLNPVSWDDYIKDCRTVYDEYWPMIHGAAFEDEDLTTVPWIATKINYKDGIVAVAQVYPWYVKTHQYTSFFGQPLYDQKNMFNEAVILSREAYKHVKEQSIAFGAMVMQDGFDTPDGLQSLKNAVENKWVKLAPCVGKKYGYKGKDPWGIDDLTPWVSNSYGNSFEKVYYCTTPPVYYELGTQGNAEWPDSAVIWSVIFTVFLGLAVFLIYTVSVKK